MGGRFYDPHAGRFASADPLIPDVSFSQSYDPYAYVFNNPLRYTDPSGLSPEENCGTGGCGGGVDPPEPEFEEGDLGTFTAAVFSFDDELVKSSPLDDDLEELKSLDGRAESVSNYAEQESAARADAERVVAGVMAKWQESKRPERVELDRVPELSSTAAGVLVRIAMPVAWDHLANGAIGAVEGVGNIPTDVEDGLIQRARAVEDLKRGSYLNAADHLAAETEYGSMALLNVVGVVSVAGMVRAKVGGAFGQAAKGGGKYGSYTVKFKSGKSYHGKGPMKRANQSARRKSRQYGDEVDSIDWTPAESQRHSFADEALRLANDGGKASPTNYNKIDSPGAGVLRQEGLWDLFFP